MKSKKILKHIVKACKLHMETTLAGENYSDLTKIQQGLIDADKAIIHYINSPEPSWAGNYTKILVELKIYLTNTISYSRKPILEGYKYWEKYINNICLKEI